MLVICNQVDEQCQRNCNHCKPHEENKWCSETDECKPYTTRKTGVRCKVHVVVEIPESLFRFDE